MTNMKSILTLILLSFLAAAIPAMAQEAFPTKPITLIVGYAPGGATDVTARALSNAAEKFLGRPIVILNKPGGATAVSLTALKKEKPDGYTLATLSTAGILSQHMRKLAYDITQDFTPICQYSSYTYGLVVRSDAPWKTFKELLDYVKANPGKIKYSTSGPGTMHHLVMERLALELGLKWVHIPYEGGHPATTALLGGHVDVEACTTEWKPYVESGRLRLLVTYGPKRLPKYPDVPTLIDLGINISGSGIVGVIGPKGISRLIVNKLAGAFKEGLENPEVKKATDSLDMPVKYLGPEELTQEIQKSSDEWGKLIRQLGLRKEY